MFTVHRLKIILHRFLIILFGCLLPYCYCDATLPLVHLKKYSIFFVFFLLYFDCCQTKGATISIRKRKKGVFFEKTSHTVCSAICTYSERINKYHTWLYIYENYFNKVWMGNNPKKSKSAVLHTQHNLT